MANKNKTASNSGKNESNNEQKKNSLGSEFFTDRTVLAAILGAIVAGIFSLILWFLSQDKSFTFSTVIADASTRKNTDKIKILNKIQLRIISHRNSLSASTDTAGWVSIANIHDDDKISLVVYDLSQNYQPFRDENFTEHSAGKDTMWLIPKTTPIVSKTTSASLSQTTKPQGNISNLSTYPKGYEFLTTLTPYIGAKAKQTIIQGSVEMSYYYNSENKIVEDKIILDKLYKSGHEEAKMYLAFAMSQPDYKGCNGKSYIFTQYNKLHYATQVFYTNAMDGLIKRGCITSKEDKAKAINFYSYLELKYYNDELMLEKFNYYKKELLPILSKIQ